MVESNHSTCPCILSSSPHIIRRRTARPISINVSDQISMTLVNIISLRPAPGKGRGQGAGLWEMIRTPSAIYLLLPGCSPTDLLARRGHHAGRFTYRPIRKTGASPIERDCSMAAKAIHAHLSKRGSHRVYNEYLISITHNRSTRRCVINLLKSPRHRIIHSIMTGIYINTLPLSLRITHIPFIPKHPQWRRS